MIRKITVNENEVDEIELLQEALGSGEWNMSFNEKGEMTDVYWSPVFRRMIGYRDESDFPNVLESWTNLLHEEDKERVVNHYWNAVNDYTNRSPYDIKYRLLTHNRGYRWFHAAGRIARRNDGTPISFVGFFIDIDDRVKAEEHIKQTNKAREEQLYVLKSLARMYFSMHLINLTTGVINEYSADESLKPFLKLDLGICEKMKNLMKNVVVPEYQEQAIEFTDLSTIAKRMKGIQTLSSEFVGVHMGWFIANFITVETDKDAYPTVILFTIQVIDEIKQREQVLFLRSMTDELTGFYNRRAYEEQLEYYRHNPIEDDLLFVCFDINNLKLVNDNLGHAAGDEMLRGFAAVVKKVNEEVGGKIKVYRIGGDEFVGLFHLTKDLYPNIKARFNKRISEWKGKYVGKLSVSSGDAFTSQCKGLTIDEIAKLADRRMYEDKANYYRTNKIDRRRH